MKTKCLPATVLFFFITLSSLYGQDVTSSSIAGIITDGAGEGISRASITAVHEPTGTTYSIIASRTGRYRLGGMRVGGPYTVEISAPGFETTKRSNITLGLQQTTDVNIRMRAEGGDVFELEAFEVVAEDQSLIFVSSNQGSGSRITEDVIKRIPSVTRSLSDIAKLDSRMAVFDKDTGQMSAGGKNTRYNSLLIDGVPTNDTFGLSESGLPSLKQPFSLEAISEVSVQLSPYYVENAGFTGAAITAITKSGTNEFRGSVFGYYRDASMVGKIYEIASGDEIFFDDFEEYTVGFSLGGPIIKNKLFFYFLYETVEETRVREESEFLADPNQVANIVNASTSFVEPFDPGTLEDPDSYSLKDDKLLLKLDWNITDRHRATFRYNTTPGSDPNLGSRGSSFNSSWYQVDYGLDDYVAEIFSNWTSEFTTTFRVSYKEQTRDHIYDNTLPEVSIQGIKDTDDNIGGARTVLFGHGTLNELQVNTFIAQFKAAWLWGNHQFSAGLQYESYDNYQLRLSDPYGRWFYRGVGSEEFNDGYVGSLETDENGNTTPGRASNFSVEIPAEGATGAADWSMAIAAAYFQDNWNVNEKLNINAGVRIDYPLVDNAPPSARDSTDDVPRSFEEVFGIENTNTIDGNYVIQPRVGFNFKPQEDSDTQFRGGIGLFFGTAPHVWLSNAYVNNGVSKMTVSTNTSQVSPAFTLDPYEAVEWVYANYGETRASSVTVNYLGEGFKMPTEWKANLAFDKDIKWLADSTLTVEYQWSRTEYDIHYVNNNMALDTSGFQKGFLPDGREIYTNTGLGDDRWREAGYRDVLELRNVQVGRGHQFTLELQRPVRNNWGYRLGYTNTINKTINDSSSASAYTNWIGNVAFNPNEAVLGTSSFETRHRILGSVTVEIPWRKQWVTSISVVYDGRSGRPFSYLYGGVNVDVNQDGNSGNDLIYVPTDVDDPLISWGLRNEFRDSEGVAFMEFVDSTPGLREYKGQIVPRNTGRAPWIHQFDINITQDIPIWKNHKVELILNIQNIGNLINDEWGLEKRPKGSFGRAVNLVSPGHFPIPQRGKGNEFGYYIYRYPENNQASESTFYRLPVGLASRWAMQFGVRYSF
ncbi:MAG: carboxypeptidase regulatory-like domain-containing protein [Puniceicoccaceae bacterium]